MNEPLSNRNVIVTDIRMPFWSMVIFIVKLAIAAIPAMILLALIGAICMGIFTAVVSSLNQRASTVEVAPTYVPPSVNSQPSTSGERDPAADRCFGSPEPTRCQEEERRLAAETPEQRLARQRSYDAERRKNMERVRER